MKKIYGELARIQKELKAPKNLFNKFGNYKYRNAEGILEAVKPLLNGYVLLLSDEIEQIGERYYVKATATLTDGDESVAVSARAREDEYKKGMDGCQITGSCSSYARKYALNGLFDIDDTKDSDDDSLSPKNPANEDKEPNPPIPEGKNVSKMPTVPPTNENPVKEYMESGLQAMQDMFGFRSRDDTLKKFTEWRNSLMAGGVIPATKKITTIEEAKATFDAIFRNFKPSDGESA